MNYTIKFECSDNEKNRNNGDIVVSCEGKRIGVIAHCDEQTFHYFMETLVRDNPLVDDFFHQD